MAVEYNVILVILLTENMQQRRIVRICKEKAKTKPNLKLKQFLQKQKSPATAFFAYKTGVLFSHILFTLLQNAFFIIFANLDLLI